MARNQRIFYWSTKSIDNINASTEITGASWAAICAVSHHQVGKQKHTDGCTRHTVTLSPATTDLVWHSTHCCIHPHTPRHRLMQCMSVQDMCVTAGQSVSAWMPRHSSHQNQSKSPASSFPPTVKERNYPDSSVTFSPRTCRAAAFSTCGRQRWWLLSCFSLKSRLRSPTVLLWNFKLRLLPESFILRCLLFSDDRRITQINMTLFPTEFLKKIFKCFPKDITKVALHVREVKAWNSASAHV